MARLKRSSPIVYLAVVSLAALWLVAWGIYLGVRQLTGYGWPIYGVESIQVPYGKLFLARSGDRVAAVKLIGPVSRGDGGTEYAYWYQGDGSGDLTAATVEHGTGVVFERYTRSQLSPGHYAVTDVGGQLNIKAGPLWLGWSMSNHVYVHPHQCSPPPPIASVEITATDWTDVNEVDLSDRNLRWIAPKTSSDTKPSH